MKLPRVFDEKRIREEIKREASRKKRYFAGGETVHVGAVVPVFVRDKLVELAKKKGISMSEVIREAILQYLEEEGVL